MKRDICRVFVHEIHVASFAEAWIETPSCGKNEVIEYVASFAEAWIETLC